MNCSQQDEICAKVAYDTFKRNFVNYPKMMYKIKEIGGDYYYEQMTFEETCRKAFLQPSGPEKYLKN